MKKSFTIEYDGIRENLITDCFICKAFDPRELRAGLKHPPLKKFKALWDTGASGSVISEKVASSLGLKFIGREIVYHVNGESKVKTYGVNILLPNNVGFPALKVTEGVLTGIDVLIGMDIISKGDFAITSFNGNTKFSFNVPSVYDIDFNKDNVAVQTPIHNFKVPGRNSSCPCGSGKKYKHCCGK